MRPRVASTSMTLAPRFIAFQMIRSVGSEYVYGCKPDWNRSPDSNGRRSRPELSPGQDPGPSGGQRNDQSRSTDPDPSPEWGSAVESGSESGSNPDSDSTRMHGASSLQ